MFSSFLVPNPAARAAAKVQWTMVSLAAERRSGHNGQMKPRPNVGRNETCPCGSGRKYKVCCQPREHEAKHSSSQYLLPGIVIALIVASAATAALWSARKEKANAVAQSTAPALPFPRAAMAQTGPTLTPQPPGPVPEGKVWSPEHGHWHDAATGPQVVTMNSSPTAQNFVPAPQPPGPVPEGKVWSTEHGHWHDAPGASTVVVGGTGTGDLTPTGLTPPAPSAAGVAPSQSTASQASAVPVVISTPAVAAPTAPK